MTRQSTASNQSHMLGAVLSLTVALLLLTVMLYQAETLTRLGLIGNLWFLVLLAMGVAVAVFLFLAFKSYAHYTGTVLTGRLKLGGPPVVDLLPIISYMVQ